jgi:hypothetical protein
MRKIVSADHVPMCVSVTPTRHGELRRLAERHDTSVSAIVNVALDDLLECKQQASMKRRLSDAPLRKPGVRE